MEYSELKKVDGAMESPNDGVSHEAPIDRCLEKLLLGLVSSRFNGEQGEYTKMMPRKIVKHILQNGPLLVIHRVLTPITPYK